MRERILVLLRAMGRAVDRPWPGDRALELDSLQIVQLHEELELAFDLRIQAREVTPAAFGTLDGLCALVQSKMEAP